MGFDSSFGAFGALFCIVFLFVIGTFVATAIKGIGQWSKNNNSPRLTVPATVVSKRTNVTRHRSNVGDHPHHHT